MVDDNNYNSSHQNVVIKNNIFADSAAMSCIVLYAGYNKLNISNNKQLCLALDVTGGSGTYTDAISGDVVKVTDDELEVNFTFILEPVVKLGPVYISLENLFSTIWERMRGKKLLV